MAEPSKRCSQLQNCEHGHSGKKARARGMTNNGVVKQEWQERKGEKEEEEEREEGEVGRGSDARSVVVAAAEPMGEPQISLRLGLTLFHCRACLHPLKPPTFKCEAGHVVCYGCRASHGQVCGGGGGAFTACVEVDAFVRDAKQPCAFEEFGCKAPVVYHEAEDHHRACPWAPCSCPSPGCDFFSSPARLLDHFAVAHAWPVTEVSYGRPHKVAVPAPQQQGWHALVGEDDGRVFLVSACALGGAAAVSLVCVRANGDAAEGATQYRCKLWAEVPSNKDNMTMMMSMVRSSNLTGGFPAADQGMFLAVPLDILHDVSGEAPALMIRIDRAGLAAAAAAAARSSVPPGWGPRRLQ